MSRGGFAPLSAEVVKLEISLRKLDRLGTFPRESARVPPGIFDSN